MAENNEGSERKHQWHGAHHRRKKIMAKAENGVGGNIGNNGEKRKSNGSAASRVAAWRLKAVAGARSLKDMSS
jgi:hypothetical protein